MILMPNNIAHIWLLDFRTIGDEQLDNLEQTLSDDELARAERFSDPELKRKQLITRLGVRSALSQYSDGVPPKAWQFERDAKGKPRLAKDSPLSELSFNLSHSEDWLVVATTVEKTIGVDLQRRHLRQPVADLAERFFHPNEAESLAKMEGEWQREQFFRFWTLKEAYLKARGLGLSGSLDKVQFHLDNNGLETAEFDPALEDDPHQWQFHHFDLESGRYSLALALKQPRAQHASPHFYKLIPGKLTEPLELSANEIQID